VLLTLNILKKYELCPFVKPEKISLKSTLSCIPRAKIKALNFGSLDTEEKAK
jgi:hypothetical protein